MSRRLNPYLKLDSVANAVLIALSTVSGLLTYQGMKQAFLDTAATWLSHIAVAAVALAVTLIIYLFWRTAFRAVDALERGVPLFLGMCITLAFLPFIFGMSSWFNVSGTAGARAQDRHIALTIARMEQVADQHIQTGLAIDRLGPTLKLEAARYRAEAISECTGGARTGSGGEGTMCFTLRNTAGQLSQIADVQLPTLVEHATGNSTRARALLEQMRAAAGASDETSQKVARVASLADQLRGALGDLDPAKAMTLIRAGVGAVPDQVGKLPLSATTKAGRAKQQAALDTLKLELRALVQRVEDEIAAAPDTVLEPLPSLDPLNAATAVFLYADHFVPFWVAGVALDLMPLAILLFLLVQRATLSDEELAIREVLGLSLRDQLLSDHGIKILRAPGPGQKSVTDAIGSAFGKPLQIGQEAPETASFDTGESAGRKQSAQKTGSKAGKKAGGGDA